MPKPRLSIIIPNYNETANLQAGALDKVTRYLKNAPFTWEVIVSDDGSTDGSCRLVEKFCQKHSGFQLLKNPHGGKAQALWAGTQTARGEIVIFTDMDQSTPLKEVEKLLPWYQRGFDVVFGSRGKARKNFPWFRQITSWGFRQVRQLFLLKNVMDTQCGFKSFRTKVAQEIFPLLSVINRSSQVSGWSVTAYDVEILFLARKRGYLLKEVEVLWQDEDVSTSKSKNFITESTDMLKQILRVKIKDLRGEYEVKTK